MAFTDKIKKYAGDLTGLDSTNAIKQAVDHTLAMAKQVSPIQYQGFVNKIPIKATIAGGLELASNKIFDVIKVTRGDYMAQPIAPESEIKASDSGSIYYAQAYSPVYVVDFEGSLKIYPDCADTNATTRGAVYVVFNSDHKTVHDANETVKDDAHNLFGQSIATTEKFPTHWKQYLILHAAEILLGEKLIDMGSKLPTDLDADTTLFNQIADVEVSLGSMSASLPSAFSISTALPSLSATTFPTAAIDDALAKAKNLIDDKSAIGDDGAPLTVQEWLEDEDEDMVQATLQVAAQELGRANAILSDYNAELSGKIQDFGSSMQKYQAEISKEAQRTSIDISKYQAELSQKVADKQNELGEYQANLQKKMALYDKIISKLGIDYQWITAQIPIVQAKKQEFLQSVGKGGMHDSPDEGQI